MSVIHPTVSAVLVTYNRASLLNATIRSLLQQTLRNFDLIIADDASLDSTQEICERWAESDGRIRYHRRSKNVGMPENMNLGILASAGEYVAVLHDDDMYRADLLQNWKFCLDQHPNAAFVFNAYRALDARGETRAIYRETLPPCSPGSILLERIFFKRWRFGSPVWGTVMMRRSAFDYAQGFDRRFGYYADVDMWMRLAEVFDVCYVDEPLISVTSAEIAPHQFDDASSRIRPLVERMFWEARMRHYERRPVRRIAEAFRHWSYVGLNHSWERTLAVNRQFRRLRRIGSTEKLQRCAGRIAGETEEVNQ